MTVAELIAELQKYPPDAKVFHQDFEFGHSEPSVSWQDPLPIDDDQARRVVIS